MDRAEIIKAKSFAKDEVTYNKKQSLMWQNPSITFDYGEKTAASESGKDISFAFRQPFYFPGKLELRRQLGETKEKLAGLSLEETKLMIRYEVIRLSYAYKIAEEKASHITDRVNRFSIIEDYLKNKPFHSPKHKAELYIIQSRLSVLQKHLIQLESDSEIAWEKLNFYLGLEKKPEIKVQFFSKGILIKKEDLIKDSIEKNFEIKFKENELQITKITKMLAEKEKYSDFSIGAVVGQDQSGIRQRFYDLTLTFNIPVLDRNQNAVRSLEYKQKSEELQLTYLVKLIEQKINSGYISYLSAKKIISKLSLNMLKELEMRMNFADNEFKKGRIDIITFLELENQIHETHHLIYDSQFEYVEKYLSLLAISASENFLLESNF
jgi:hypothetical protein